jgi:hypothetical protein
VKKGGSKESDQFSRYCDDGFVFADSSLKMFETTVETFLRVSRLLDHPGWSRDLTSLKLLRTLRFAYVIPSSLDQDVATTSAASLRNAARLVS